MSTDHFSFRLDGKNVAVIGAGSGIGAAIARGCGLHGGHVVCLDVDATAAEERKRLIDEDGGTAEALELDIRDSTAVDGCLADIHGRLGSLDVVVSTPSINVRKPMLLYQDDEFDQVVSLNLKGTFHVMRTAGRIMQAQAGGSIIVLSSIRSLVVEPGQAVYAATKAGLVQLVRTLAAELGSAGVRVNAIAPGVVDTPLTEPIRQDRDWYDAYAQKSALQRWASADEMAGPAVFLASDASSYVTGTVLFVDGGWTAVDGRFSPPGM